MSSKQDAIAYLQDLRQHYTDYHEHKEKSAWAAVVLYVLFAGTLLPIQLRGPDTLWYDVGYALFILIIAALVFLYARNQFALKNEGRVYVAASLQLLAELMAMDDEEFDSEAFFRLPAPEDANYDSAEVLPATLLRRADRFRHPDGGWRAADLSRVLCYLIIAIITVGLLAARFVL